MTQPAQEGAYGPQGPAIDQSSLLFTRLSGAGATASASVFVDRGPADKFGALSKSHQEPAPLPSGLATTRKQPDGADLLSRLCGGITFLPLTADQYVACLFTLHTIASAAYVLCIFVPAWRDAAVCANVPGGSDPLTHLGCHPSSATCFLDVSVADASYAAFRRRECYDTAADAARAVARSPATIAALALLAASAVCLAACAAQRGRTWLRTRIGEVGACLVTLWSVPPLIEGACGAWVNVKLGVPAAHGAVLALAAAAFLAPSGVPYCVRWLPVAVASAAMGAVASVQAWELRREASVDGDGSAGPVVAAVAAVACPVAAYIGASWTMFPGVPVTPGSRGGWFEACEEAPWTAAPRHARTSAFESVPRTTLLAVLSAVVPAVAAVVGSVVMTYGRLSLDLPPALLVCGTLLVTGGAARLLHLMALVQHNIILDFVPRQAASALLASAIRDTSLAVRRSSVQATRAEQATAKRRRGSAQQPRRNAAYNPRQSMERIMQHSRRASRMSFDIPRFVSHMQTGTEHVAFHRRTVLKISEQGGGDPSWMEHNAASYTGNLPDGDLLGTARSFDRGLLGEFQKSKGHGAVHDGVRFTDMHRHPRNVPMATPWQLASFRNNADSSGQDTPHRTSRIHVRDDVPSGPSTMHSSARRGRRRDPTRLRGASLSGLREPERLAGDDNSHADGLDSDAGRASGHPRSCTSASGVCASLEEDSPTTELSQAPVAFTSSLPRELKRVVEEESERPKTCSVQGTGGGMSLTTDIHKQWTRTVDELVRRHVDAQAHQSDVAATSQVVYKKDHERVSVLFCDIVGYTAMSSALPGAEVLEVLNSFYSMLDTLTDDLGVYKVETIGDAYIVACNLVDEDPYHELSAVLMGETMLRIAESVPCGPDHRPLQIRVGVHTGPLTTGVVGRKRKLLSLVGDTMNVAARMEQNGRPGCVRCTTDTWNGLPEALQRLFEEEVIDVKGKGDMRTFLFDPRLVVARGSETGSLASALQRTSSNGGDPFSHAA
ncbi:unnamed protein product [Pedinophyceae sp. YPF-701]|nr:unnamed protein product [Pedinophyceae sp. YPF-701]